MRAKTRKDNVRNRVDLDLEEIATWYNPVLQGWLNYYGSYCRSAMYPLWRHFNMTLASWVRMKYKTFWKKKTKAAIFVEKIARQRPELFVHWRSGMRGAFA